MPGNDDLLDDDSTPCVCGHVRDEHDERGHCDFDEACGCITYDFEGDS